MVAFTASKLAVSALAGSALVSALPLAPRSGSIAPVAEGYGHAALYALEKSNKRGSIADDVPRVATKDDATVHPETLNNSERSIQISSDDARVQAFHGNPEKRHSNKSKHGHHDKHYAVTASAKAGKDGEEAHVQGQTKGKQQMDKPTEKDDGAANESSEAGSAPTQGAAGGTSEPQNAKRHSGTTVVEASHHHGTTVVEAGSHHDTTVVDTGRHHRTTVVTGNRDATIVNGKHSTIVVNKHGSTVVAGKRHSVEIIEEGHGHYHKDHHGHVEVIQARDHRGERHESHGHHGDYSTTVVVEKHGKTVIKDKRHSVEIIEEGHGHHHKDHHGGMVKVIKARDHRDEHHGHRGHSHGHGGDETVIVTRELSAKVQANTKPYGKRAARKHESRLKIMARHHLARDIEVFRNHELPGDADCSDARCGPLVEAHIDLADGNKTGLLNLRDVEASAEVAYTIETDSSPSETASTDDGTTSDEPATESTIDDEDSPNEREEFGPDVPASDMDKRHHHSDVVDIVDEHGSHHRGTVVVVDKRELSRGSDLYRAVLAQVGA